MTFFRTSIAKQELARAAYSERRKQDRERNLKALMVPTKSLHKATMRADTEVMQPRPKIKPVRDEQYRRLVAALPCAHCGIHGISQHAHENDQKGKGVKLDDRRAMPLCADQPGREGCHKKFDEYRLFPGGREAHVAFGKLWAKETRMHIRAALAWPKNLPLWRET